MFRIKICGLKTLADVTIAVQCGTEAVGFNFYPKSVRYVSPEQAAVLVKPLSPDIVAVGVFVNESVARMQAIARQCHISWIQLHGDEPPEVLPQLAEFAIIRAFRIGPSGTAAAIAYLNRCKQLGCLPQAILLDAYHPQQYGGTGERLPVAVLQDFRLAFPQLPMLLAGGLNAENVAQAIQDAQPDGVDTASGVESEPGVKANDKSCIFVTNAQEAFRKLARGRPEN